MTDEIFGVHAGWMKVGPPGDPDGSRGYGWCVGILRRGRTAIWDCGHQHEDRGVALACSRFLIAALRGEARVGRHAR